MSKKIPSILIIDDDIASRFSTHGLILDLGKIHEAGTQKEALSILEKESISLIILDFMMPDVLGYSLLKIITKTHPNIPVIMLSSHYDLESAIECLKLNARDYILKENAAKQLANSIQKVLNYTEIKDTKNSELPAMKNTLLLPTHAIYKDQYQLAIMAAKKNLNILISGPTGSGKDVLARYIHQNSKKHAPFIAINCAAIVETLAEMELFGSEAHAYTGAELYIGKLEEANGRFLFLDEIATMPLTIQAKLLRALDCKEFYRVGGKTPIQSGFTIISATNAELEKECMEGRFRSDLYFRIKDIEITLPSLKDYPEIILEFINFFTKIFNQEYNENNTLSAAKIDKLTQSCAGNIRSLKKEVRNMIALGKHYPIQSTSETQITPDTFKFRIEDYEKQIISQALEDSSFNISKTADTLGLKRSTLSEKIKRYNLKEN